MAVALPDGRRALSASADKTLKLWDLETGNPLAAFTADSDLFAVASRFSNWPDFGLSRIFTSTMERSYLN